MNIKLVIDNAGNILFVQVRFLGSTHDATSYRSFLGLVSFSARFIRNLRNIDEPLHRLTRKQTPFVWGTEQQGAFDALKDSLTNAETLAYFESNAKETKLITDASPVGL